MKASAIRLVAGYTNEKCVNCGRHRVELVMLDNGHQYRICEKCHYIKEQERCCEHIGFSFDFTTLNRRGQMVKWLREDKKVLEDDQNRRNRNETTNYFRL